VSSFDLTPEENANVRAAILFLRARLGGWARLAKMLHMNRPSLRAEQYQAQTAFKVSRVAGVGVDDVLTGRYPPAGACRHCGHMAEEVAPAAR